MAVADISYRSASARRSGIAGPMNPREVRTLPIAAICVPGTRIVGVQIQTTASPTSRAAPVPRAVVTTGPATTPRR